METAKKNSDTGILMSKGIVDIFEFSGWKGEFRKAEISDSGRILTYFCENSGILRPSFG